MVGSVYKKTYGTTFTPLLKCRHRIITPKKTKSQIYTDNERRRENGRNFSRDFLERTGRANYEEILFPVSRTPVRQQNQVRQTLYADYGGGVNNMSAPKFSVGDCVRIIDRQSLRMIGENACIIDGMLNFAEAEAVITRIDSTVTHDYDNDAEYPRYHIETSPDIIDGCSASNCFWDERCFEPSGSDFEPNNPDNLYGEDEK
jgi:hypothetical protein